MEIYEPNEPKWTSAAIWEIEKQQIRINKSSD